MEKALDEKYYEVVRRRNYLILKLIGDIDGRISELCEELNNIFISSKCRYFIIDFEKVSSVKAIAHRPLTMLQHNIRNIEGAIVRTYGFNRSPLKIELIDKGVIRGREINEPIKLALALSEQ